MRANAWFTCFFFPLGFIALLIGNAPLFGHPPADEIRVARLVRQLGSEEYAERTAADEELAALGPGVRASLEQAAQDADPEVRLRAKDLLTRLKLRELWSGSVAQLPAEKMSTSKLLAALAARAATIF